MPSVHMPHWSRTAADRLAAGGRHLAVGGRRLAAGWRRITGWIPRRVRTGLAIVVVSLFGMLLGLQLFGSTSAEVGPFRLDLRLLPSTHGESQLRIPPVGSITVDSHDGPVRIVARVDSLEESETKDLLSDPQRIESASDEAAREVSIAVRDLIIRGCLVALGGAVLLGLILFRSWRKALACGGTALVVLAGTGGWAAATFNPQSIREPRYEGLLTNVPAVVGDARNIYARYGEYRGELVRILTNMSRVYTNVSTLPTYQPDPGTIRVLHVTDLHLNPTSYPVIGTLVDQFQANMVIDTGDLTDWGSSQESAYASNIGKLGVPYVFVRGNHDSATTADAVAAQRNAIVLENQVVTVDGLVIAGIGSSRFTPDKTDGDTAKDEDAARSAGRRLAATCENYNDSHDETVDVALVHEPKAGQELADCAPLVLGGHTHRREVKKLDDDTTLRIEGSTGARGLRGLGEENPTSLQMSMLYFSPAGQLQAYDEITVSGAGQSEVVLKRTILPTDR